MGFSGRVLFFVLLFFNLSIFFPAINQAQESGVLQNLIQEAHEQRLSNNRLWRLLLHYRKGLFGREESGIDDPHFFLSKNGRTNLAAELDATLTALVTSSPSVSEEPPQCRYPARTAWLRKELPSGSQIPDPPCPRFENWKSQMSPDSVSVVFASYYMNNPASMYGHTFLRFNQKKHGGDQGLLDYAMDYAAEVNTHNGILFALYGLTGGYRGRFSTLPYYMKVQQYSNLESRDLWEYTLNLSTEGVERITEHLWELGHTSMAYYFLNKNCSYQLLPLLEVGDPSLHLSESFVLKTVPADTLRILSEQPGPVSAPSLRPSHVRQMLERRSHLSPEEVRLAGKLTESRKKKRAIRELKALAPDRQALVLDSAYDLFRYRVGFHRDQPAAVLQEERELLLLRSRLEISLRTTNEVHSFQVIPPDQGHKSGRVGVGFGFSSHSMFEEVSARPAIHDLEADPSGFVSGSQLEMLDLRLRFDNDRKVGYLEDLTLLNLESLSAWDRWIHSPSWNLKTGLSVARDVDRDPEKSLYYGLNLGSGLAFESHLWRREMIYGLAEADSGAGSVFDQGYRLGGGGRTGLLLELARFWRVHLTADFLRYPLGDIRSTTKLHLIQVFSLSRNLEFRSTLERQNTYKEALFTLNLYL